MKISALKPKQRALLSFLLLVFTVFAIHLATRKPGGWWKGENCSLSIIEQDASGSAGILVSNDPNITTNNLPGHIHYVIRGKAADEIILILNRYDVWRWKNETTIPKMDAGFRLATLEYKGKTNDWAWYPSSVQSTHNNQNVVIAALRNLGKYGTPNTSEMQKQFIEIWQIMQTQTNDVTRIR
jgi:hypothetical protein